MTTHLTWLALRQKPIAARVLPTHGACARAVGSCHWKVHWKRIFQPESGPQGQIRGQTWLGRSSMLIALEICPVEEGAALIYDGTERLDSKCSIVPSPGSACHTEMWQSTSHKSLVTHAMKLSFSFRRTEIYTPQLKGPRGAVMGLY